MHSTLHRAHLKSYYEVSVNFLDDERCAQNINSPSEIRPAKVPNSDPSRKILSLHPCQRFAELEARARGILISTRWQAGLGDHTEHRNSLPRRASLVGHLTA
jgi:hypothetical protein